MHNDQENENKSQGILKGAFKKHKNHEDMTMVNTKDENSIVIESAKTDSNGQKDKSAGCCQPKTEEKNEDNNKPKDGGCGCG